MLGLNQILTNTKGLRSYSLLSGRNGITLEIEKDHLKIPLGMEIKNYPLNDP